MYNNKNVLKKTIMEKIISYIFLYIKKQLSLLKKIV